MATNYLSNPAIFLIDTLVSLYLLALMLRFLFQWVGAEYHNPISRFLVKITHPPLRIFRRFIPPAGRIDNASLMLMLFLRIFADYLIFLLSDLSVSVGALVLFSFTHLLSLLINIFFFAIIARALLSWFNPDAYNPAVSLLHSLTEPTLRTVRGVIPPISGIDLSPIFALIGLELARMLLIDAMQQAAALLL